MISTQPPRQSQEKTLLGSAIWACYNIGICSDCFLLAYIVPCLLMLLLNAREAEEQQTNLKEAEETDKFST
jgi:hypothetical protein